MKIAERILVITDILLGALHSDATITGLEATAARNLLAELLLTTSSELPEHVEERIVNFRIINFDLEAAVRSFLDDPPMKKRRLLELVAFMIDADGEVDLAEDDFMRSLADALDMQPEEYKDLVLHYEISRLRDTLNNLLHSDAQSDGKNLPTVPPPIPDDARREK